MCTSITWKSGNSHFVGRNLDFEVSYGQKPVTVPRNYPLQFRNGLRLEKHFAMIGMAVVAEGYPLFFDATNEKGLSVESLLYPGAKYSSAKGSSAFASFEFTPYLLGSCKNVAEARKTLENIQITDEAFSEEFPPSPLHYMVCDQKEALTVEIEGGTVKVYENPVGVLTNRPSFDKQLFNLNNYLSLSVSNPSSSFSGLYPLHAYSRGMGTKSLPGGLDSESRFVRAAFAKFNADGGKEGALPFMQFFHILRSAFQIKGLDMVEGGPEYTIYTSCVDMDEGTYRYMLYDDFEIREASMRSCDLNSCSLIL